MGHSGQEIDGLKGFGEDFGAEQLGGQSVGHAGGVGIDSVEMLLQLARQEQVVIEKSVGLICAISH